MKFTYWIGSVLLACATLACGSDSSTGPKATQNSSDSLTTQSLPATGTYVLQSVDGLAPPVGLTYGSDGTFLLYVADTIFAHADWTWVEHLIQKDVFQGGITATADSTMTGTYTRTGNSLVLTGGSSGGNDGVIYSYTI